MELPDFVTILFVLPAVLVYAVLLAAALALLYFTHKSEWRLGRTVTRQRRKADRLRQKGRQGREALAVSNQRRNLKEFAALIREQLRRNRTFIELGTYHQCILFLKESIEKLRFDRMYAMHGLLEKARQDRMSVEIDSFLQRELEHGDLGEHRQIHFQDILHGQDGVRPVAEGQPAGAGRPEA